MGATVLFACAAVNAAGPASAAGPAAQFVSAQEEGCAQFDAGTPAGQPPAPMGPSAPDAPRSVVFDAPFTDASQWGVKTTAYPPDTSTGHAQGRKLDRLSTASVSSGGSFLASRSGNVWDTDLMTTENTPGNFKVRTGDSVQARVTVYDPQGAWPALWTWGEGSAGNGEVDLFEYHSTNSRSLEFRNHVRGGCMWATSVVEPGRPFTLRVDLNPDGVVWFVNGARIYQGPGLPADWSANLIANLSVADGSIAPHVPPAPEQQQMRGMTIDSLTVSR